VLTEELEAANDQLAHELRTPLARIRGNVEHILKQAELTPVIREDAARAIDEIKRATALIQNILSIRAGDSGVMKLNIETLSLAGLVEESFELYSAAAEEKALEFRLIIPERDRPLSFDQQRFQQAVCNLLDNAIAYTPRGGTVELELKFENEGAVIFTRDSGPGLSEADSQRIWRRFMRGSAASANAPGIGLGLSLVKAVANAHHGDVGARNRPEGGAEFWIRIPIDRPKPLASQ
jgi:signal transduction histidine kinase